RGDQSGLRRTGRAPGHPVARAQNAVQTRRAADPPTGPDRAVRRSADTARRVPPGLVRVRGTVRTPGTPGAPSRPDLRHRVPCPQHAPGARGLSSPAASTGAGEGGHEQWLLPGDRCTVGSMTLKTTSFLSVRRTGRLAAVGAAALTAAVVLTACGSTDGDASAAVTDENVTVEVGESDASAEAFNDADVMFVQMMIPHHAQALEMAEIMLAKEGLDPEVVALVEQIRDAQGPEIALMTGWLADW